MLIDSNVAIGEKTNNLNLRYRRIKKPELDFIGEPTKQGRHRIHSYPAMLHPFLVDYLLDNYTTKEDIIFDPFVGSGVTLLQSSQKDRKAIGFDINSLALLISKVKTTVYNKQLLYTEINNLKENITNEININIPNILKIDYWY